MKNKGGIIIIAIILAFALMGCTLGNVHIKPPPIDQVISTGPKVVGALVAQNNPTKADDMIKYGEMLLQEGQPVDFKESLDKGIDLLLRKYVTNAGVRALIIDLLPEIEIDQSAIPTPEWMDKVKPIIKAFIEGVRIGAPPEISFIQRYCDIYEANYLKFLWGRSLATGY